jgi:hypothetical protein
VIDTKLLSELHDARLVGIAYGSDRSIHMDFITVASVKRTLAMLRVVNFFCSGMLEGNIVQSIEVVDAGDISAEDLKYFVSKEGRGQTVAQLEKAIQDQSLCMVLLTPSYGAELACVCADVAFA